MSVALRNVMLRCVESVASRWVASSRVLLRRVASGFVSRVQSRPVGLCLVSHVPFSRVPLSFVTFSCVQSCSVELCFVSRVQFSYV